LDSEPVDGVRRELRTELADKKLTARLESEPIQYGWETSYIHTYLPDLFRAG